MFCSNCGTQLTENVKFCPNCGTQIYISTDIKPEHLTKTQLEENLCCPKCLSPDLHAEKSGFSGGKALAGAVLTGGIGLLAGTIGSSNVYITCLKCGNRFKAGEALTLKKGVSGITLEEKVVILLQQNKAIQATKLIKDETGCILEDAYIKTKEIAQKHNIFIEKSGSGCLVLITLIILGTISTFLI